MVIPYSESTFIIELLLGQYNNYDPKFIKEKAQEDLKHFLTESQIIDYIHREDDYERISSSVAMAEIFNDYEQ